MTVLSERVRAVLAAKQFLYELSFPAETPGVPSAIRKRALAVLRHFPFDCETETAYRLEAEKRNEPLL